MILPRPQVVAIDDERKHLDGLVKGLALCGVASLPVLYRSESEGVPACPHVRVIFADLHLGVGTPSDHTQDFSTIGGLLEDRIRPTGPYMIVLWTRFADQARQLEEFLRRVRQVPAPFGVRALDKSEFLDEHGGLKDAATLVTAVKRCVREEPQLGALLNWEGRVLDAAAESVASIAELARRNGLATKDGLGGVLRSLAAAGVGESRVNNAPFRGVNDALVPILADRITFLESLAGEDDLWREAIGIRADGGLLDETGAARLNRLLHIDSVGSREQGAERGAVIALPAEYSGDAFEHTFDMCQESAASRQFRHKFPRKNNGSLRWVLVQTQAACDYAQEHPGPLPFFLGINVPTTEIRNNPGPHALWQSPVFEREGKQVCLHVNARFAVSLARGMVKCIQPMFRLREQILSSLLFHIHSYRARPGIISLRGRKAKGTG